ncbi:hypothetical protein HHK36_016126 [Tetracentron sinense]|uniref:Ferritin n=1 Tax=Tetracentron sinense TaxID=13715 RepID=A0A835DAQ7_TETSI|nr:hypothetical protein HHK36_016126 [Tetracentron sinense]
MLLRAASAFSLSSTQVESLISPFSSSPSSSSSSSSSSSAASSSSLTSSSSSALRFSSSKGRNGFVVSASDELKSRPLIGVVFDPFEEVKKELLLVPTAPQASLARHKYSDECEAAINEQIKHVNVEDLKAERSLSPKRSHAEIPSKGNMKDMTKRVLKRANVEYNVSYVYHAMYAYLDRDNIALKGIAKFFEESSEEERQHAEKLMEYQIMRGGKVRLLSILNPLSEFDHFEKGDALYAMELALSLEKLTNEKLLNLLSVADRNNDVQLAHFVESEFLTEQVEAIKKISEYVAQLRRVGKGHGVWHFDQMLLNDGVAA